MGARLGRRLILAIFLLALAACTHPGASANGTSPPAAAPAPTEAAVDATPAPAEMPTAQLPARDKSEPGIVDYSCSTDADCAIKDVGNCCGTYPACVNRDSPTFPEQVKAQCAEKGMMGVCGFPVLSGCQCVDNRCEGVTDAPTGAGTRID